jgi:hypothetical protein
VPQADIVQLARRPRLETAVDLRLLGVESEVTERRQKIDKSFSNIKYLGIIGVRRYDPVVYRDDKFFVSGSVELDVWLVDWETEAVLCEFSRSFKNSGKVTVGFSTRSGQTQPSASEVVDAGAAELKSQARQEICKTLAELTGGTFQTK